MVGTVEQKNQEEESTRKGPEVEAIPCAWGMVKPGSIEGSQRGRRSGGQSVWYPEGPTQEFVFVMDCHGRAGCCWAELGSEALHATQQRSNH